MKNSLLLLSGGLVLLLTAFLQLPDLPETADLADPDSRTYKLCDVEPATQPLPVQNYREVVAQVVTSGADGNDMTTRQKQLEDCADRNYDLVLAETHPFAYAVQKAYAEHRPLAIAPDMIWLMILQGFAQHVDANSDELRDLFVDFSGKKMLNVKRNNFVKGSPDNDWESVFPEFGEQINTYTKDGLDRLINQSFTTSTTVEQSAFQITVMDAMSAYFQYSLTVMCGIPEITIEGTPEDWGMIEQQLPKLAGYDLGWWTDVLTPLVQEFKKAADGAFNPTFWAKIYDYRQEEIDLVCAKTTDTYLTGWLLDFFPYIDGERNPYLGEKRTESKVELSDLTSGLAKADLLYDDNGRYYHMELMSGFVGIRQDPETRCLRPEISWAVVDTGNPPSKELKDAYTEFQKLEHMQASKR